MADRYAVVHADTCGTADATASIVAVTQPAVITGKRGWVYDVVWGTTGTAADNQLQYKLQRHSTVTAETIAAQKSLDFDAPDSLLNGVQNVTTITLTAGEVMLQLGANQRSSQRWVSAPGGEISVPNVALDGLTFYANSAQTITVEATMQWEE